MPPVSFAEIVCLKNRTTWQPHKSFVPITTEEQRRNGREIIGGGQIHYLSPADEGNKSLEQPDGNTGPSYKAGKDYLMFGIETLRHRVSSRSDTFGPAASVGQHPEFHTRQCSQGVVQDIDRKDRATPVSRRIARRSNV